MPIHCNAKKQDIAKTVLMPGDPLRAKYIAENSCHYLVESSPYNIHCFSVVLSQNIRPFLSLRLPPKVIHNHLTFFLFLLLN